MSVGERFTRPTQVGLQELIMEVILTGGLSSGEALPTEQQLVERLGVSRNAIREALRGLQALGIVDIRHGYGTFVGGADLQIVRTGLRFRARLQAKNGLALLNELIEVREALERGLIGKVIREANAEDIDALDKVVEQMSNPGELLACDRLFHELLFRPSKNRLVLELVGLFWDSYHDIVDLLGVPDSDPATIASRHATIVDAVRARDVDAALVAMQDHTAEVKERLARIRNLDADS